ncbi:hypothetical protein DYB26_006956 [Aphanomyces astaci]|uniref:Uncharacterized protein n=2 Tax=Aphanomyces astaci TaxID=112090 RepID=A0A3R6XUE2_APHAT|nr:hypothetical protein DYB26_006956 [Aphanomyces astaci]
MNTKSPNMVKSPGAALPRINRPGKISLSEDSAGFHWWPLPIALTMVFAIFYMGNVLYDSGWLDQLTGGLVSTQFNEENILTGGCAAINHAITWRELSRKARRCARGSFYDPLHNTCAGCIPFIADDKFMAVSWDTKTNCSKARDPIHVYWSFATVNAATGAVVAPVDQQDNTPLAKCMLQLRTRCIRQIGVIGDISAQDSTFAALDDANLPTFVSTATDWLDGINIADPTGNTAAGAWTRGPFMLKAMKALREGLDEAALPEEPRLTLSWDEYAAAFDTGKNNTTGGCGAKNPTVRCFPAGLDTVVDTIQLQMHRRPESLPVANITATNWTAIIPRLNEKIMYTFRNDVGLTPKDLTAIAFDGTYKAKGVALYSATEDVVTNKAATLRDMGAKGAYGILMPTQLVHMPILPY